MPLPLSDALTQAGLSTQQWAIFDSYRPKCTEFIFAPKMLPSKRASSRSGTSCSSRFLDSRRLGLPLGKVKPQLYRILNNCPHRPPGCSVARCVVTNTTLTWQKCAQPPRATTQLILAGSLLTELYTLSEILSRYERSYTTNPARVEAINA